VILDGVSRPVDDLIERDGAACVWCGREHWRRDLRREHVVPRSRGGHMTPENALVASERRSHRDEAARHLRRLDSV
jgi:5-methylcytosine-specific restriction endonuclease McrA